MARKPKHTFSDGSPLTYTKHEIDIANRARAKTEQEKAAAKDLRETRVQQIMSIMRQVADKTGKALWDTPTRLALAKGWGIDDNAMKKLSNEAHHRVIEEARGKDTGTIERNLLMGLDKGLLATIGGGKWKDFTALGGLADKILGGPTKMEVTIETKQPTAADANAAMQAVFGNNDVTNADKSVDVGTGSKPAETEHPDSPPAPGSTPKE